MSSNTDTLLTIYESAGYKLSELMKELAERGCEITVYSDYAIDYAQIKFCIRFKYANSYSYMILYEDDLAKIDDVLKCGIESINKERTSKNDCKDLR